MIKAITFDLWDTIFKDDSDEPKRAALGLPSKPQARLQLLVDEITRHHPEISPAQVGQAFDYANQIFEHHWQVEHFTPSVSSRLQNVTDFLKIPPTPGFAEVVRRIEEMKMQILSDPAPGIHEVLAELSPHYILGVVSDTVYTPGRCLRQLLQGQNLLRYFRSCVFSNEVGVSKPNPTMFEQAAAELGVPLSQIMHVGDRESNDIGGPLALGMKSLLYTGVIDRGSENSQATAICQDYAELPRIIKEKITTQPMLGEGLFAMQSLVSIQDGAYKPPAIG